VFMPECSQYKAAYEQFLPAELCRMYAQPYKERCAALAKKYSAYVVPWDYEEKEGKVYNSSYILDRGGEEIGRYRKVNPTPSEINDGVSQGMEYPVFDLDIGKVGIMICFDNYFPESARILALNGAQLILYPLFGDTLKEGWQIKTRARAIDYSVYVAPCHICSCPKDTDVSFTGLIGPDGAVLCKLTGEGCYAVVEIDMNYQAVTSFAGFIGAEEDDIKQFLLKSRNTAAFGPVTREVQTPPWEDIVSNMARYKF